MTERTTETVSIGKGVKYAKVADRLKPFHGDNDKCAIETSCKFEDGYALFSATVTTGKGVFTGHSLAKIAGREKQFEKQETIAVGRALAFAGYLASREIACAEEMDDFVTDIQLTSLKLKYAKIHADELKGLDQPQQRQMFNRWCKDLIGEDVDYSDHGSWNRGWREACWEHLAGPGATRIQSGNVDSGVPFEEA